MLKMRLTRIGKKHQPAYRIVVTPKENPALGQYLDLIGTYNPLKEELQINNELALSWLNKGVLPSDRVARLLQKSGVEHKSIVIKNFVGKPKSEPKEETKPAAAAAPESTEEATEAPAEEPAAEEVAETPEAPVEETPAEEAAPEETATEPTESTEEAA